MTKKNNTESTELVQAASMKPAAPEDQVISYDTTGNDNDVATEQAVTVEATLTESDAELVAKEIDDGKAPEPTWFERLAGSTLAARLQFGFALACLAGKLQNWWIKAHLQVFKAYTIASMWADTKLIRFGKWARRTWDNCTPMTKGFFIKVAQMARDNPLGDTLVEQRLAAMEALMKAHAKELAKLTKQASQVDPDVLAKYTKAIIDGRNGLATELFRHMTGSTIAGAKLHVETLTAEPAPA